MIIFVRVMFLPPLWQTRRNKFFSPIGSKQAWNNEKGSKNNLEILRPVEVIKAFLNTYLARYIVVDFRSSVPQEQRKILYFNSDLFFSKTLCFVTGGDTTTK